MMSWDWNYRPYVSAATRRAKAAKHAQKLAKQGEKLSPVTINGRIIARSFWGKAWCEHLESFSDYENRLPRGRTYVRSGSVIDLQITAGKIITRVMGSSLYQGAITVAPLKVEHWKAIKTECAGKIDSLVGLLQGRLSDAVMRVISHREKGLFPKPSEIKMECSCPDSAGLCKHLAAVLYGVGARLDASPELLFVLRGVAHLDLIGGASDASALASSGDGVAPLDAAQLSDVFGIEIEPLGAIIGAKPSRPAIAPSVKPKPSARAKKTIKPRPPAPAPKAEKTKTKTKPVAKKHPIPERKSAR